MSNLPPAGKDPAEWTADEIEAYVPRVLTDPKAVDACLTLLALRDPERAERMLDTIQLGLALAERGWK